MLFLAPRRNSFSLPFLSSDDIITGLFIYQLVVKYHDNNILRSTGNTFFFNTKDKLDKLYYEFNLFD